MAIQDRLMTTLSATVAGTLPLHPMLVHFPIVLWLTAFAFTAFSLLRDHDEAWRAGVWLHILGTVGGLFTIVSGYLAAEQLGHDSPGHDLVHGHRDLMLVTMGVAVLASGIALWVDRREKRSWRWMVMGLLGVVSLLTVLGADRGAQLVYRYGMGVMSETIEAPDATQDQDGGHGDDGGGHNHAH
jgi:uncharacterized membrane protein